MEKRIYKPPHFRDSEAFYSENYRFNEISIPVRVQKFVFKINENRNFKCYKFCANSEKADDYN